METDGGWVSISEASRLYGKDPENGCQIRSTAYDIETRKRKGIRHGYGG